jgi:hypothetical protein
MAEVTIVPEKTEVVVLEEAHVSLKLTNEEAEGLRAVLYGGVGVDALEALGLRDLSAKLTQAGIKYNRPQFGSILNMRDANGDNRF